MKLLLLGITLVLLITGCQESSSKKGVYLLNSNRINPNSLANRANDKAKDRANRVELSKIDSDTKIKIAKLQSDNQLLIAKVNAEATKEVAITDSTTKIQTTQIDATTKKEDTQMTLYVAIAMVIVVLIALYMLYLNNKHSRELKAKLHEDKLKQELLLKEKEHHEQRLHKMLDLVAEGKLSSQMEEEIIHSISNAQPKTIESKK